MSPTAIGLIVLVCVFGGALLGMFLRKVLPEHASFGMFSPRNAIAIPLLFLGAVSLSAAIFLIGELNNPLEGFISISRTPMEMALGFLGQ